MEGQGGTQLDAGCGGLVLGWQVQQGARRLGVYNKSVNNYIVDVIKQIRKQVNMSNMYMAVITADGAPPRPDAPVSPSCLPTSHTASSVLVAGCTTAPALMMGEL